MPNALFIDLLSNYLQSYKIKRFQILEIYHQKDENNHRWIHSFGDEK